MSNQAVVIWKPAEIVKLPKKIGVKELVTFGTQLSEKDQNQIISAFELQSYEMVSTYVWTKSINALRSQLSKMGMSFIGEMLDRPDINENSNIQQAISEYEAILLAEELGVINGTISFRLRQAMETVAHFNQPDLDDTDPENELTEEEAKTIVRSCIQGILGYTKVDAAIDFKNFRRDLEETTLLPDNSYLNRLLLSPYFFHKTTIRILIALIKSATGAYLENALGNANTIVPQIWENLKHPERFQVGRTYSELSADGKTRAASGLRQLLLRVKGFDFVPEDLRSTSFMKVGNDILSAHENMNNFYNEPGPVNTLNKMGSVIPIPAFPICITAVLCVKLGNRYGVSDAAQDSANEILRNITRDRWVYFFRELLETNQRVLYKLSLDMPSKRWINLLNALPVDFNEVLDDLVGHPTHTILKNSIESKQDKLRRNAIELYSQIGYVTMS